MSGSAITKHVKISPDCLQSVCSNDVSHFSVVARARLNSHLDVFKVIFIARLKLKLCLQKEFVGSLCLFCGICVMLVLLTCSRCQVPRC